MSVISDVTNYTDEEKIKYFKTLAQIAKPISVCFFNFKDKKYMIGQVDEAAKSGYDSFVISYDDEGTMKAVTTFYEHGHFQYKDDKIGISLGPDNATYKDMINQFTNQLIYMENESDESVFKALYFLQTNEISSDQLLIKYNVSDYPNPDIVLGYLNNRKMDGIQFNFKKLFHTKIDNYCLRDGVYYKYKELAGGRAKIIGSRRYGEQELIERAHLNGFATTVPNELIEVYKGNNDCLNDMKVITDTYIKSAR